MVEPTTTLYVTTQVVSLDVAVVDKKGHPAPSTLSREDFTITEDGKPQQILYFEAPSSHTKTARTTVFVLDALNTERADTAYYLVCLERYLRRLPATLPNPAELIMLSAGSVQLVQPSTRSRTELLASLKRFPAVASTPDNVEEDRFQQTLTALHSIALEHLGDTGKTDIVWLGPGDGIDLTTQPFSMRRETDRFVRYMTNTFVQSRTTLYVIFPPDVAGETGSRAGSNGTFVSDPGTADPYRGGVNFRTLAAQTGGAAYVAMNDLAAAMREASDLGSGYYTLGYRPAYTIKNGQFRQIRLTLRNPNLHVVTKSGYYAPDREEQSAPQKFQIFQMTEAGRSPLPIHKQDFRITHIDRSPDGKSAEFTVLAEGSHFRWSPQAQGGSLAELTVGGLSLSKGGDVLASHFRNVNMMAGTQDHDALRGTTASFKLTLPIPSDTDRVRLVLSLRNDGRLSCVDASSAAIKAAEPTSASSHSGS